MTYNALGDYTEEELLLELIDRLGHSPAPVKTIRHTDFIETIVGIGNDYSAYITMDAEAYEEMQRRSKKPCL